MSDFEKSLKEKSHEMSVVFRDRTTLAPNPELALKLEEIGRWAREWCNSDIEGMKITVEQYNYTNQEYRKDIEKLRTSNQRLRDALEKADEHLTVIGSKSVAKVHWDIRQALAETGGDDGKV